jgi:hypothetical protein
MKKRPIKYEQETQMFQIHFLKNIFFANILQKRILFIIFLAEWLKKQM